MAPSQPMSAPPKVSRQPSSQPVPRCGECGQRSAICAGSMLLPYAAYNSTDDSTDDKRTSHGCAGWLVGAKMGPWRAGARAAPGPAAACDTMGAVSQAHADVAILGGGPGGYEAALVAAQLGAQVTVVEADGLG